MAKIKKAIKAAKALNKAIKKEVKKDPSFNDKVDYYNYLVMEKKRTDPKKIAEKMKAFVPAKPIKMRGGGIAVKGFGKVLKGNK